MSRQTGLAVFAGVAVLLALAIAFFVERPTPVPSGGLDNADRAAEAIDSVRGVEALSLGQALKEAGKVRWSRPAFARAMAVAEPGSELWQEACEGLGGRDTWSDRHDLVTATAAHAPLFRAAAGASELDPEMPSPMGSPPFRLIWPNGYPVAKSSILLLPRDQWPDGFVEYLQRCLEEMPFVHRVQDVSFMCYAFSDIWKTEIWQTVDTALADAMHVRSGAQSGAQAGAFWRRHWLTYDPDATYGKALKALASADDGEFNAATWQITSRLINKTTAWSLTKPEPEEPSADDGWAALREHVDSEDVRKRVGVLMAMRDIVRERTDYYRDLRDIYMRLAPVEKHGIGLMVIRFLGTKPFVYDSAVREFLWQCTGDEYRLGHRLMAGRSLGNEFWTNDEAVIDLIEDTRAAHEESSGDDRILSATSLGYDLEGEVDAEVWRRYKEAFPEAAKEVTRQGLPFRTGE
jgi:hypothetical protein